MSVSASILIRITECFLFSCPHMNHYRRQFLVKKSPGSSRYKWLKLTTAIISVLQTHFTDIRFRYLQFHPAILCISMENCVRVFIGGMVNFEMIVVSIPFWRIFCSQSGNSFYCTFTLKKPALKTYWFL